MQPVAIFGPIFIKCEVIKDLCCYMLPMCYPRKVANLWKHIFSHVEDVRHISKN